jgi:hypothetical protein
MARDVEANGGTVALHLTGLSQLLAEVGSSNRDTLRRLVGGLPPSMMPSAETVRYPNNWVAWRTQPKQRRLIGDAALESPRGCGADRRRRHARPTRGSQNCAVCQADCTDSLHAPVLDALARRRQQSL